MISRVALAAALVAATVAVAPLAQAATFTFTGGESYVLPGNFDPSPSVPGVSGGTTVLRNGVLGLSGPGKVTFSYVGTEAGYDNQFLSGGTPIFSNHSGANSPVEKLAGAGPVDFAFSTASPFQLVANGSSSGSYGSIALFRISDTSVYALFNDSATSDTDYDDMAVRMDVAPVPLPAAAWLLVAGLGGLGLVKRRARAAA